MEQELTVSNKDRKFYRADVGFAVFGFFVENNFVVDAAPIAKWLIGKNIFVVRNYVKKKGGSLMLIEEDGRHKIII